MFDFSDCADFGDGVFGFVDVVNAEAIETGVDRLRATITVAGQLEIENRL